MTFKAKLSNIMIMVHISNKNYQLNSIAFAVNYTTISLYSHNSKICMYVYIYTLLRSKKDFKKLIEIIIA